MNLGFYVKSGNAEGVNGKIYMCLNQAIANGVGVVGTQITGAKSNVHLEFRMGSTARGLRDQLTAER